MNISSDLWSSANYLLKCCFKLISVYIFSIINHGTQQFAILVSD